MLGEFHNIKIQGMAAAVPENTEDNSVFEPILGARRLKKQLLLTGIQKRHVNIREQQTSDLCYTSACRLLDDLKWDQDEIKILIMVTQTANYVIPATAMLLHKRLGLNKDCLAYDINLGCSSFPLGIQTVSALLQSCRDSDKALLLIGDTSGGLLKPFDTLSDALDRLNPEEVADHMLFGSAGAAIALEKDPEHSIRFLSKSDGNGYDAIMMQHYNGKLRMNGAKIFDFAINDVAEDVKSFRQSFRLSEDDIDYYVFHQAQSMILDNIIDTCNIPPQKELRSLEAYGNTSGTSVPVSICANIDKLQNKETIRLLMCGFGIGLSWGIIYADVPTEHILPIIEVSEHYDEDKLAENMLRDHCILVQDADTDLGEGIARHLYDMSAVVILSGTDECRLENIRRQWSFDAYIHVCAENDSRADCITAFCREHDLKLNGIVYSDTSTEYAQKSTEILKLAEEGILASQCSIVITSPTEDLHVDGQRSAYLEQSQMLQAVLDDLTNALRDRCIRINGVLYASQTMKLVLPVNDQQDWVYAYLEQGCSLDMRRSIYCFGTIADLLKDDSQLISGTLIRMQL